MEGADDAISGSGDGQHQTTIVSNLTSMTGDGNEAIQTGPQSVDEFETDSKWEITTLEKASYDCSDMYAEASPDQQNPAPESASDTNQSADCMSKTDDSQDMTDTAVEQPTNSNTEDENDSQITTEHRQASGEVATECSNEKEIEVPTKDVPKKPAEQVSSPPKTTDSEETDQQKLSKGETNEMEQHQIYQICKIEEEVQNSDNVNSNDKSDSLSPQHHQDDGAFSLSQTAVDPQMEKMIDNIVELGGCQQFADTLQQQAEEIDREREVESIQREISNASNSLMKGDESSEKPAEADIKMLDQEEGTKVREEEHYPVEIDISTMARKNEQPIPDHELKKDLKEVVKELPAAEVTESVTDTLNVEPISKDTNEDAKEDGNSKMEIEDTTDTQAVELAPTSKNKKIAEHKQVKGRVEDEIETVERTEDKKSLPERPVRQARLRATKRAASPEPPPKEAPEKRKKSKEPEVMQEKPTKQKLIIKVPIPPSRSLSARKTIATSAPSTVPEPKKIADTSFNDFECKKYRCEKCKYSTDRLNNIVHHKKSSCSFFQQHYADHVAAQVESWKRSIQSPKSNSKRSAR